MDQEQRRIYLIKELLSESPYYKDLKIPENAAAQKELLRGLMNIRRPAPAGEDFLKVQDEYLKEEIKRKGITDADDLIPVKDGLYIWQGDITCLKCDAIVNAANSGMTGCYIPSHGCIDNCIHTFSGVQLRLECAKMIKEQRKEEQAGGAKITLAYNLPAKYVIHTVGPIVKGRPSRQGCELLSSCYRSCLLLAADYCLGSIAFCCISTGEFHFPSEQAAKIAAETVEEFMKEPTSIKKVIFNVFKDKDREIYERLLKKD